MVQFSNPETAAQFEAVVEDDRTVTKQLVYSGPLSNITPAMAAAMVSQGSNLVKEKVVAVVETKTIDAVSEKSTAVAETKTIAAGATKPKPEDK